jgi:hypothetical protein
MSVCTARENSTAEPPLVDQAAREFERLSRRGDLDGPDDPVFVGEKGRLDYEKTKDDFYAALPARASGTCATSRTRWPSTTSATPTAPSREHLPGDGR